jgi:histidinol-phosphatase (PHP family)
VLVDYHMHLAPDGRPLDDQLVSEARLQEYVTAARERGIDEIALTEHVYRFHEASAVLDHPYWRRGATAHVRPYVELLARAADEGLPVRAGIELDWLDGRRDELAALIDGLPLDVVLGSVHMLPDGFVDHPDHMELWEAFPVDEVYARYFAGVRDAVQTGLYDVMTHLDLPKVFGQRASDPVLQREYVDTADAIGAAGCATEISTAGLRKPVGELYPDPRLLAELRRRDVPITLASDAHVPEDVGRDYDAALRLAHDAGYRTVTAFRRREARQEPLG